MRAFGAPAEQVARYRARLIDEQRQRRVDIFPENWHAMCVFLGMGSQWRTEVGFGGRLYRGLEYASLPIVLAENRRVPHRQPIDVLMPQLRTLEATACTALNDD